MTARNYVDMAQFKVLHHLGERELHVRDYNNGGILQFVRVLDAQLFPWRIARNSKMQFRLERRLSDGSTEVLHSDSDRPRSFKTWAGAERVRDQLNRSES